MPVTRARPACSPTSPATSLTLELVEAVHGVALAACPRAPDAAPQAKIAATVRSERSRRRCEEKDCISISGSEPTGGEFIGRRALMRRQVEQNASRFCERNKAETPRLLHARKLLFPINATPVLWSHASA